MVVPTAVPKDSSKPGYVDLKWCHIEAYSFLSRALQLDDNPAPKVYTHPGYSLLISYVLAQACPTMICIH